MPYNPNILDTSAPKLRQLDIATPVNTYNAIKSARAQQRLQDLTLSQSEKKVKRQAQYQQIMQGSLNEKGQINSEQAISNLNQAGLFEESQAIQNRMQTAFENKQKLKSEMDLKKGKMFEAVLSSENPVEAFMIAREDAVKNGIELSPGLMSYEPTFFETQDRRLDEKVATELDYLSKKAVAKKGPMSLEDKLLLMRERYGEKKNLAETKSKIKVEQPLTEAQKNAADIAKIKAGIASKKLTIEENKEEREAEVFEQTKLKNARKNRAYKQKNKSQLDSIQTFLDKAYSISKSPDMAKISGAGRYGVGGSKIPIVETKGKDLQADIDFLTDMGVIETMTKLKAESPTGSTGFGALSEKELMVMKNAFSLLGNPEISGKKKKMEVDRVIEIMERRAREQREYDRESETLLGPEKTEDEVLIEGIDGL